MSAAIAQTAQLELSGLKKAAVLTLLVGEDTASQVFKHLTEDEIERIAREVATIGRVATEQGTSVLEEFHSMWQAPGHPTRRGG